MSDSDYYVVDTLLNICVKWMVSTNNVLFFGNIPINFLHRKSPHWVIPQKKKKINKYPNILL